MAGPSCKGVYYGAVVLCVLCILAAGHQCVRVRARCEALAKALGGGRATRSRPAPLRLKPAPTSHPSYSQAREEVDWLVERAVELGEFREKGQVETSLSSACELALRGGKRVRAVIAMEVARAASRGRVDAAETALFVEYVHAAALVVDDLPAFDDDAVRRGRPAVHAKYGVAVANMAAITLIAAAFQNACRQVDWLRENAPAVAYPDRIGTRMCSEVANALGASGAAGGQYMDVSPAGRLAAEFGPDAVKELAYRKTATFFELAVVCGWLVGGGDHSRLARVRAIGSAVGTAFQVADDIGDEAADRARGKWNYAASYGAGAADETVCRHLAAARADLAALGLWTPVWDEIFDAVLRMTL